MCGGGIWTEPNEIYDFENADRVHDKECDEPLLLSTSRGVPEGVTLDRDCPDYSDDKNR